MIQFADPEMFWLLGALPVFSVWYFLLYTRAQPSLHVSAVSSSLRSTVSIKNRLRHSLFVLRLMAFSALVIALARPQVTLVQESIASEGIDIMLTLDISGSMLSKDFVPSRLEAAKKVATDFVDGRPNDRIGAVFFAAEAYSGCPLTIDHAALNGVLTSVKTGSLNDGTAIGMGLGTAIRHLDESQSPSKVIILVTDGENNAGALTPMEATQLALAENIRVYCIGILPPSFDVPRSSVRDSMYASLNIPSAEIVLTQIAELTGAKYFRATNEKKLALIYQEIDQLEKTKRDVTVYKRYQERFFLFGLVAALILLTEVILRYTVFRTIP